MSLCFVPSNVALIRSRGSSLRKVIGRGGRRCICSRSRSPFDDVEKSISDIQRDLDKFQRNMKNKKVGNRVKVVTDYLDESSTATRWGLGALGVGFGALALMSVITAAFSIIPIVFFPLAIAGAVTAFGLTIAAGAAFFAISIPAMIIIGSLKSLFTLTVLGFVGFSGYKFLNPKREDNSFKDMSTQYVLPFSLTPKASHYSSKKNQTF